MAQNWTCTYPGCDLPHYVVVSWPETGTVDTPCLEHWAGLCISVALEMGYRPPPVEPPAISDREPEGISELEKTVPLPDPPDLGVTNVVRHAAQRKRSRAERGAMHSRLREADGGTDQG